MKQGTKQRHSQWAKHVKAFERSKLSRAEYCRKHDINYDQLGYYIRTLAAKIDTPNIAREPNPVTDFYPLRLSAPSSSGITFTLTQRDGSTLSWSAPWNAEQVASFIMQLETAR